MTFESLLGKLPDSMFFSDYYGIEIKTRRAYSKSAITLFNATPDGEDLFEIERLKNKYVEGIKDSYAIFKQIKTTDSGFARLCQG